MFFLLSPLDHFKNHGFTFEYGMFTDQIGINQFFVDIYNFEESSSFQNMLAALLLFFLFSFIMKMFSQNMDGFFEIVFLAFFCF